MKNAGASVRARLLNHARATGESFNSLLEQYATGRFLWRLSRSPYRKRFILKGAQLFRLWSESVHRPTRDLDLLGFGDPSEEGLASVLTEICKGSTAPDDGLLWGQISTAPIREDMDYGGTRALLQATLDGARVPLQIDIGFGDVITPDPVESEWVGLLGFPSARLLAYPPETVIAEKFEAAVTLGIGNSRMKDFFDLHWLRENQCFAHVQLSRAIQATFDRRGTRIPEKAPLALTSEFGKDSTKVIQWNAFLRKRQLQAPEFPELIARVSDFLLPLIQTTQKPVGSHWHPDTGWDDISSSTLTP